MTEDEIWKSEEAVQRFRRVVDAHMPGRPDILSLIARIATEFAKGIPTILDIGCGCGDVTGEVLKLSPDANITMVDYSDEMLRIATADYGSKHNIRIVKYDLNYGIPDELDSGSYDAVVSCVTLHHINYDKRVPLYEQIWHVIKDGGWFINGDQFKAESLQLSWWEFDNWMEYMVEQDRKQLGEENTFEEVKKRQLEIHEEYQDRPGTVWEMQNDLHRAGFKYVDCLNKTQVFAVIAAQK